MSDGTCIHLDRPNWQVRIVACVKHNKAGIDGHFSTLIDGNGIRMTSNLGLASYNVTRWCRPA